MIDPTAQISEKAILGEGTEIFSSTKIRENVKIGKNCIIRNFVYIDRGVQIGNEVKIMDHAQLYRGVSIGNNVFIGPRVSFLNDKNPRTGIIRDLDGITWKVDDYASIGGGAIIQPDVTIGKYALIASGAIVTKEVPAYGLIVGIPGKLKGFVCEKAHPLPKTTEEKNPIQLTCEICKTKVEIPLKDYQQILP